MNRQLLAGLVALISACNSNSNLRSFTNMNELELAQYNRGLPVEKQVFCLQDADSSSYIRKRVCQSYEDWIQQTEKSAMTLDVLNSLPGYSPADSIRYGSF